VRKGCRWIPTEAVRAAARGDLARAAFAGAAIAGTFGLAYALRAMQAATVKQVGPLPPDDRGIVLVPVLVTLLLRNVLHLRFQIGPSDVARTPELLPNLRAGAETFVLGMPLGFMVEEVFFRGALDTYLHHGEEGTDWLSAVFVSAVGPMASAGSGGRTATLHGGGVGRCPDCHERSPLALVAAERQSDRAQHHALLSRCGAQGLGGFRVSRAVERSTIAWSTRNRLSPGVGRLRGLLAP